MTTHNQPSFSTENSEQPLQETPQVQSVSRNDEEPLREQYRYLDEHVEYREAIRLWIEWAKFRRQGLLFASAAHAAVIAANTSSAVFQGAPLWLLPLIGMGMALVGLLNEVFLFNEMMNFKRRAAELEQSAGYSLISAHKRSLSGLWQFATANLFRLYHLVWFMGFAAQLVIVLGLATWL